MNIYFLHGLESGPRGSKFVALQEKYPEIKTIDFQGILDPNERLNKALVEIPEEEDVVLVGSSMGGLVSYMLEQSGKRKVRGMVLCAPALLLYKGEVAPVSCPTTVIHGTEDEILDFEATKILAKKIGAKFVDVRDNHRLKGSITEILQSLVHILAPH